MADTSNFFSAHDWGRSLCMAYEGGEKNKEKNMILTKMLQMYVKQ
jgi:hypothetical protein